MQTLTLQTSIFSLLCKGDNMLYQIAWLLNYFFSSECALFFFIINVFKIQGINIQWGPFRCTITWKKQTRWQKAANTALWCPAIPISRSLMAQPSQRCLFPGPLPWLWRERIFKNNIIYGNFFYQFTKCESVDHSIVGMFCFF